MDDQDFFFSLVEHLITASKRLRKDFENPQNLSALLQKHGWQISPNALTNTHIQKLQNLVLSNQQGQNFFDKLQVFLDKSDGADEVSLSNIYSNIFPVLQELVETVRDLTKLSQNLPGDLPAPFNSSDFWREFPSELVNDLFISYLESYHLALSASLVLLGMIEETWIDWGQSPPAGRLNYLKRTLQWDRLTDIAEPQKLFEDAYGWGTNQLKFELLLDRLRQFLVRLGIEAYLRDPDEQLIDDYYDSGNSIRARLREFRLPIIDGNDPAGTDFDISLFLFPIPADGTRSGAPVGFVIGPYISGKFPIGLSLPPLGLTFTGGFESSGAVRLEVRPGKVTPRLADTNVNQINAGLSFTFFPPMPPRILIGTANSHRFQIIGASLGLKAIGPLADPDLSLDLGLDKAELVIDNSSADSFIKKIVGDAPQIIGLEGLGLTWSSKSGLTFRGKATLELIIGIHQTLAFLYLDTLLISFGAEAAEKSLQLMLAVCGNVKLGPLTASVDRIGIKIVSKVRSNADPPGTFGNIDLSLRLKPPNGVGLALDAKAVTGGGYLFFDSTNEQYAGVLQLEIQDVLALKAIGLLTTRLPDGSKGFSLLVIISAEFPPIQLGFGFVLTGVGGLFGANRTMVLDVLRAGIKNRTLDSILFPKNPVANAAKIISDLQSVFPPVSGRFVFGPMAILGWGTPTLLTIELGIVLELPSPVRLAIMGQLKLVMPDEKAAVVILRMDVLGTIDFGKSDASIDATIYDSRVAQYVISGDMAMRLNWGASPAFALSAGGFNPRFQPPPDFPSLARLAISLATGDNPRLRLEAYLALTPNTVQFGARLDAYAELDLGMLGRFTASAYLGFDALVHFSPFSFVVDVDGAATIKRNGDPFLSAWLHLTLSGPQPWHAYGEATFDLLGKQHITIDVTAGAEAPPPPLPPGDPLKDLQGALADIRNWSAQLPTDGHMMVTLRQIPISEQTLEVLMHPFGELTFHQKAVPLDTAITRYGSTTPISPGPFSITKVTFNDPSTEATRQTVRDLFAPGQFFQLTDDEQLSRPAFELLPSGCNRIGTSGIKASQTTISAEFEYETVVIDKMAERLSRTGKGFEYALEQSVILATAAMGAAGQSAMRTTGGAKFAGSTANRVKVREPEYAVSSKEDMTWDKKSQASYAEAEASRKAKGVASEKYQVVGTHEVV